jgi:GNAT superfamily N-acetyltransferase
VAPNVTTFTEPALLTAPENLGDGLVMRHATPDDLEALVAFNATIHREGGQGEPSEWVAAWTRDLMTRPHPTLSVSDFLVVVDEASGRIVSSLNLISQTWSYAGIEFRVGRPELVGTDPEYRRRGLVRRLFDTIHRWSAERGELVQAITGIPWYYRQFGYEMALDLQGGRSMQRSAVPKLPDGQTEPYRVRDATPDDLPFILELDELRRKRYLLTAVRDVPLWRLELDGRSDRVLQNLAIVESLDGERIGFLWHGGHRWGGSLSCHAIELRPDASWLKVTPTALRYLAERGATTPTHTGSEPFDAVSFMLGVEHPLYQVARQRMPKVHPPYAFYMRVPDLPAFLRRIAPVLEQRLEASVARGYSGELKLSFYRTGVILHFDNGLLTAVEPFVPPQHLESGAWFPDLTFLQLLFGYRSREEIEAALPDCYNRGDDTAVLLDVLFPKRASHVLAIQ